MLSRRTLLSGATAMGAASMLPLNAHAATGQFWGAIRWDSWWGTSADSRSAQTAVAPSQWQSRAPYWATVNNDWQLGYTPGQAQMDAEIGFASAAGLKYWAYDWYGNVGDTNSSFGNALAFHRSSSVAASMKYCLIVQLDHFGTIAGNVYQTNNTVLAGLATDSFYMKVGTKPVFYIFWDDSYFSGTYGSSYADVATVINDLRSRCTGNGLTTPYIVLQKSNDNSTEAATIVSSLGTAGATIDAISAYTKAGPIPLVGTYATLDANVQAFWVSQLATGLQVVPNCQTGWDPRPLIERPPSWLSGTYKPRIGENKYFLVGTNTAVANHVQAGVNIITNNATQCAQKLGLIYSWDECSEGGNVLMPTLGDPTGTLLTAVGAVVA